MVPGARGRIRFSTTPGGRYAGLAAAMALLVGLATPASADGVAAPLGGAPPAAGDRSMTLLSSGWDSATTLASSEATSNPGSLMTVTDQTGARAMWKDGFTGEGIDIAMIDTGVVPVEGLTRDDKIINGPDLSFESQAENLRYLDTYGHGTHLAGIAAGVDDAAPDDYWDAPDEVFVGMAPDARILNVKVASSDGSVDVSQVIAAIDWVVQHRNDDGMNIRVLNLAFGTDGLQDYTIDPLAFAVEQAWKKGIVVVVAAGNDGNTAPLRNPAYDPFVIAVGAVDGNGTVPQDDDFVADFSNCGTPLRYVDVVAPGRSIIGLRAPGSYIDASHPEAVVEERFFLGSGTSQAAAVVSGAAALLLEQRPKMTPNQVKALLLSSARPYSSESPLCQGAGIIDLEAAMNAKTPHGKPNLQQWTWSTGLGSLDAARGSSELYDEGVLLDGEQDIFGNAWDGASWSAASASGSSWSGGDWNGATWSGASWSGASWSGASWSGASWSGVSWSGASWSSKTWSGASWSGASWSGASWSGASELELARCRSRSTT